MAAILSIYALGIVWFTFGLCAYHNYLVCTNQTTYEQIKGAFSGATNPFHRGAVGNYWVRALVQGRGGACLKSSEDGSPSHG
ncbi:unnamed protein product [Effrenium voratum]|uniref:Uncharacterized protein n=1 Tax=Effrenium voratum TaxID=2562239 RepID=A0AA36ILV3_9DINO|nr:unnamed protein product [Effrenium voratum]